MNDSEQNPHLIVNTQKKKKKIQFVFSIILYPILICVKVICEVSYNFTVEMVVEHVRKQHSK